MIKTKIFLSNFDSFLCKKLLNIKVGFDIIICKIKSSIVFFITKKRTLL